jgi:hypothetical protein
MVEDWLRRCKASAQLYVPRGAKSTARNSTGASVTTIKCSLNAMRHVLDVAVEAGHLYANPARNAAVTGSARRERAERGTLRLPTRAELGELYS